MRKINRQKEPDFWAEYKWDHPKVCYGDLDRSEEGIRLRHKLRKYLLQSQYGLCAYRQISMENSLNEHVKPQSLYPKESMNYDNLVVSCRTEGVHATCGIRKENYYDEELFVSPMEQDCENQFVFYPDGQIDGKENRGKYTCQILNLNSYELQRARMAQYKICASYQNAEMVHACFLTPDEQGNLEAYPDMVRFFYERGYFGIVEDEEQYNITPDLICQGGRP